MKKIINGILFGAMVCVGAARAETVGELVAEAARAPGSGRQAAEYARAQAAGKSEQERWRLLARQKTEGYTHKRDRVVALGKGAVPELQALRDNPRHAWAVRTTAAICVERIERLPEIQSFRTRLWREDPDLKNDSTWGKRGGPGGIYSVAVKRWLEAGLTNHMVQLAWKGDGEVPRIGHGWKIEAAEALEKIGHPDLIHIARDIVQAIQEPEDMDGHWFYSYLTRVKDHESLPMLFDLWVRFRNEVRPAKVALLRRYNNTPQQCAEEADRIVDGYLQLLLPIATVADEGWVMEKLKDLPLGGTGRMYVAQYQERCRQEAGPSANQPKSGASLKEK